MILMLSFSWNLYIIWNVIIILLSNQFEYLHSFLPNCTPLGHRGIYKKKKKHHQEWCLVSILPRLVSVFVFVLHFSSKWVKPEKREHNNACCEFRFNTFVLIQWTIIVKCSLETYNSTFQTLCNFQNIPEGCL